MLRFCDNYRPERIVLPLFYSKFPQKSPEASLCSLLFFLCSSLLSLFYILIIKFTSYQNNIKDNVIAMHVQLIATSYIATSLMNNIQQYKEHFLHTTIRSIHFKFVSLLAVCPLNVKQLWLYHHTKIH